MQDPVLENILEQMRETEARRADLEREHAEAQHHLREKTAGCYQGPESVEALQSKIRELEKKTELQMVRHEELSLELTSLKRARNRGPLGHTGTLTNSTVTTVTWPLMGSEINRVMSKIEQNNTAKTFQDIDNTYGNITTQQPSMSQNILRSSAENLSNLGHQHPPHPHALSLGMSSQISHFAGSPMPLTPLMPSCPVLTPNGPPYHYSEPIPPAPLSLSTSQSQPVFQSKLQQYQQHQQLLDLTNTHMQKQQQQTTHSQYTGNQYQESYPHSQTYQQPMSQQQQQQQHQKQQQKHSTSSSYLTSVNQSTLPHYSQPGLSSQNYPINGVQQNTTYSNLSMSSHQNSTFSSVQPANYNSQLNHHNYTGTQSNLPKNMPSFASTSYHSTVPGLTSVSQSVLPFSTVTSTFSTSGSCYTNVGTNVFGTSSITSGSDGLLQGIGDPLHAMQQLSVQSQANQLQQQAIIQQIQQSLRATSPTPTNSTTGGHHFLGPRQMPKIPTNILTNPLDRLSGDSGLVPEGQVDMLDIPGKGRCYVYIARFTYEPFQHSPNENPEAELPVQGGDYLLVWGQPDEDGFLDAETLDGRRGLVPANFVQKLVGDDLLEFHQAVLGLRDVDDSVSTNIPQDIDLELAALEEGNRNRQAELSAYAELDNIADEDEQEPPVPAPQHLTLERQLNKSVLIGWTAPDNPHQLESYHVYVDGVLKVTVKASERTRALVEGVDSNRPHRISVRSVTHSRRTSRDAACTMVIGKDMSTGPTAVKASNVTATSAVISWLPSNSNHQHVVCVNNVEVRTVKPGVYRHTITGLAPSTIYRVTVKAKNLRSTHFEDQNAQMPNSSQACHVHFKTLPKGLPDPPVDIQVEAGPQDGTLLVTWQPVTLNGSAVTGYAVYADGKKVTDVDSPTGDHALVDIHKLMGLNPKHITVRTKSRESQSGDSCATAIPCSVLRGGQVQIHQQMHLQSDQSHQMQLQMQDQSNMIIGLSGVIVDSNQQRAGSIGVGVTGQRYLNSQSSNQLRRHCTTRVDAHGQVIIETDENLSDKEIYPGQSISQMGAVEFAKDSASETNYSEEEIEVIGRRGRTSHHGSPSQHQQQRYGTSGQVQSGPGVGLGQGQPVSHRPGRSQSSSTRFQEFYYDQSPGNSRGRGTMYRGPHIGQPQGVPNRSIGVKQLNKRPRWFAALFDYDPTTMSPNPDACEEELRFSENDIIKVYEDKDADGFYWGECRGRRGYVPHNMVEEIKDPNQISQLQSGQQNIGNKRSQVSNDRWGDIYSSISVKKMIALYDYNPQELSPNVDAEQVELSFQTGNEIYVYGDMDDDGFFMGELDGVRGLVPSNFLTEAASPPQAQQSGQNQGQPLPGTRRTPGSSQGPGARGPPPPPREMATHRRNKDSRQLQQPLINNQQPLINNQQPHQVQQYQQNNSPLLSYQQANHHSYTTVTTSNLHGSGHAPNQGGVIGQTIHQPGQILPHMQQQGRGRNAVNRSGGNNISGGSQGMPGQVQQQQQNQSYQQQQQNQSYQHTQNPQGQIGVQNNYQQQIPGTYQQSNQSFVSQPQQQYSQQTHGQQSDQQQQQYSQPNQTNRTLGMQGSQTSKPMRGIPSVIPTAQSTNPQQQQHQQQQQPSVGPNLMQKFTEMAGASAGGDILSKGKELIFMKFGLGK